MPVLMALEWLAQEFWPPERWQHEPHTHRFRVIRFNHRRGPIIDEVWVTDYHAKTLEPRICREALEQAKTRAHIDPHDSGLLVVESLDEPEWVYIRPRKPLFEVPV